MAGSEIPISFSDARMNEIADLIIELPDPPDVELLDPPANAAATEAASQIFLLMPKTHKKRCKLRDPVVLGTRLTMLALLCLKEERPGHDDRPIPQGKRSYEREAVHYEWPR